MRKITIITGASSGMGAEFARQIANNTESSEIWLFARNKEKLESVRNGILGIEQENEKRKTENGKQESESYAIHDFPQIKVVPMNLSGKEGVTLFKTFLATEKISGGFEIDMLVNNAGFGTYGEFATTPLEKELEMIDLNCTALTGLCGAVLPYMHKGSSIINVASLAAFLPLGNFAVYAATKAYVLSFSVALAAELKDKGIKVSALCPGSVSTDFANVASNGARKEVLNGKNPVMVVAHCLKKAKRGKKIILWAKKWKFTAFMSRFIGRYLGARYTFKYNKRPSEWR
ncbi:MAG: SDR family NAD(P)-dependent oxidoreductase [Treponema sp.]|uniref:SDR family NAD(P)-dependent oxidoreductase n=1 Tax=Treponema sp. TaxID=166 RepID=UPI0025F6F885|nr:SDR family NAD(P)-dependent oxidoreductase [Treponema sp.]MBR0495376.1 SDR family NAD(P)-dependent oxidoreductase [Treponema sp.]